jgi:uncharacterized protein YdaU (DUF1376 family)
MLTAAWRRQARLPADPVAIQRAIGCTPQEWKRSWPAVEKYWRRDGEDLVNETQLTIWAVARVAHDRAVARARKGGHGRAQTLQARAP